MLSKKGLLLFSGGLDSILAAKLLMDQGIKLQGLSFKNYFFELKDIKKRASRINLPLKMIDLSKEQFKLVKNPKFGYGKNLNPCLDCRLLMFKQAKKIMEEQGFSFIATGEVIGERPMSQRKKAMEFLEKKAGLEGKLLRPLSAKLLKETEIEKKKIVDRKKLLAISGRSRKKQIALAKKYGIEDYPTPAGGCLLTDPAFSKRLKELLEKQEKITENDIALLFVGRHFWHKNVKIVVGRNEEENKKLHKLKKDGNIIIELEDIPGPTTLVRGGAQEAINKAKRLTKRYSSAARRKKQVRFKKC